MPYLLSLGSGSAVVQATSDSLIAIAFAAIAVALVVVLRKRPNSGFHSLFFLLAFFVLSCGITYVLQVLSVWFPVGLWQTLSRFVSGVLAASLGVSLWRAVPRLLNLPSLAAIRLELAERARIEREIRDTNRYLQQRVAERTAELERTNLRLVENELRVRRILDGVNTLFFVKDLDGKYSFVNQAFCTATGKSRDEILGRTDEELFPLERALKYRKNDERALTEGPLEVEELGSDLGVTTIYSSNKFPLYDVENRPYAVCGMATNITGRRVAEEALMRAHEDLRHSEERLRQVMDLVPDMLWSANVDGKCRFISQRYLDYTGYSVTDFENNGFLTLFHPDDVERIRSSYRMAIETGDPAEVEVRIRRHDGVFRWFLSRTVPVWNENFQVEYLISAVTDIDQLKRTEQALRRSNEELEQFAYAAAHDLQEPLRNVSTSLGMFQRVMGSRMSAEEAEWIEKSIENAVRMQAMVKDLLNYSRAVSDHDRVPSPVDSEAALRLALSNLSEAITESGACITTSALQEVPVRRQHLVQLFQNLIGNSLKYRKSDEAPEIRISTHQRGGECEFIISDNGIGFDPAYADRIFKVFKRLHNREQYEGNGIGLAICARIVAHYGGRIWADAVPGQGATFRFTLPVHQP